MEKKLVVICHQEDIDNGVVRQLKPMLGDMPATVLQESPEYMAQFDLYCEAKGITCCLAANVDFLHKFTGKPKANLGDYAGSHYYHKLKSGREIEIVFSNPLMHIHTVNYGKFLIERWVSKLTRPETWFPTPKFSWKSVTLANYEDMLADMDTCLMAGFDIETKRDHLLIDMYSITSLHVLPDGKYETRTWVHNIREPEDLAILRLVCAHPCRKVLQNGKYDALYCARWLAPIQNYLWDTKLFQFCWYAELPKDLAFLQAMYVRTAAYWKDLAESTDSYIRMEYNGRDTWATVIAMMAMLYEAPEFALKNYQMKLPVMAPSHFCELLGIRRDLDVLRKESEAAEAAIESKVSTLRKCLGYENFNTNSPVQVKNLLHVLGNKDLKSSNEKDLDKAAYRHPFNRFLIDQIKEVRGLRKLNSTYFPEEKNFNGRVLYSLNPDGTDTGRNASKESAFWCGLQIQNVPANAKGSFIADDDFFIAECDLEQAESRGTGYFTGDLNLIAAVESGKDFHSLNASAFFGYPYEEIYDVENGKVRMKALRTLSKRVNHGANYYMMEDTLIDTMGLEAIWEAKRLLKLPYTSPRDIAHHLLEKSFGKTYPTVRYEYPQWVKNFVPQSNLLTGPQGWTRYCFGDPRKSKLILNGYIAHNPQSLNAMSVDESFVEVFYKIQMHPEHRNNFRLLGQIHDSILFQYRKGHEYLCEMVRQIMERKITCTDIGGITRTFLVPAALKIGKTDAEGKLIRAESWATTE